MTYTDKGEQVLPDCTKPNPNGIEFDNLYLDMNGIIHPCAHPEKGKTPENETEMIKNVFGAHAVFDQFPFQCFAWWVGVKFK